MGQALADLVMPRTCLVCGQVLGVREKHLCIWCELDLPLTYYWDWVHNPMADEFNALLERLRPAGETMPYVYAAALMFYHHENPYKQIPQALKYNGNLAAGRFYAARLGRFMARSGQFKDVDLVVPVPLHWYRKWRRGYNQAEVIARELALALDARVEAKVLRRVRRTRSQTSLDADDRIKNVADVFRIRHIPSAIHHLLIVDDTFTTGATLSACYAILRAALGPDVRISVATLSVVQG